MHLHIINIPLILANEIINRQVLCETLFQCTSFYYSFFSLLGKKYDMTVYLNVEMSVP